MVGSTAMAFAERIMAIRSITRLPIAPAYANEAPRRLKHKREVRQDRDTVSHRMMILRLRRRGNAGHALGSKD